MLSTMPQNGNAFYTVLQDRPIQPSRKEERTPTRNNGTKDVPNVEGIRRTGIGDESGEGTNTEHALVHVGSDEESDYPVLEGSFSVWQEVKSNAMQCNAVRCSAMEYFLMRISAVFLRDFFCNAMLCTAPSSAIRRILRAFLSNALLPPVNNARSNWEHSTLHGVASSYSVIYAVFRVVTDRTP